METLGQIVEAQDVIGKGFFPDYALQRDSFSP